MRTSVILLATLLLTLLAPRSDAQSLDGEWFKVRVSADGRGSQPESDTAAKAKVKPIVFYARFHVDEGGGLSGPQYSLECVFRTEGGQYVTAGGGNVDMLDPAETFVRSFDVVGPSAPPADVEGAPFIFSIEGNATAKIKVKNEEVKNARITSYGAVAYFTDDQTAYYGRGKVSMTRVPAKKVPFLEEGK